MVRNLPLCVTLAHIHVSHHGLVGSGEQAPRGVPWSKYLKYRRSDKPATPTPPPTQHNHAATRTNAIGV